MYEGFVNKQPVDLAGITGEYCGRNKFILLVDSLKPRMPEINMLEEKLTEVRQRITTTAYQEERVISTAAVCTNSPLVKKLFVLGAMDSLQPLSDNTVKKGVKAAQQQFTLLNDGVLRPTAIEQLNIPLSERIRQLEMALDYYRWLHAACMSEPVIVVNIPAAYLKVYYKDSILLGMRMIVGRPATQTPTLTSRVDEIVFYPYWNVPRNIAVRELLPSIKQNIGYIEAGNYQVLDKSGNILDPGKINWKSMTASNFPYRIRQSTGCDNALGIVKINFYNPFTVYLHDTHGRELFMLNRRFFSHGCMRMEKPMEVVRLLLDGQPFPSGIDTSACETDQSPVTVKTRLHTPVVVWYNPVGTDDTGRLVFFEDVYGRLSEPARKSRRPK
jgi:murein L,D-transpeptidase YcbB/YkuD